MKKSQHRLTMGRSVAIEAQSASSYGLKRRKIPGALPDHLRQLSGQIDDCGWFQQPGATVDHQVDLVLEQLPYLVWVEFRELIDRA